MKKQKRILMIRWLSALTVTALYAVLYICTNFHYNLNDDVILMRSFAGCVGGTYEHFNAFTHTLLAWALYALSITFPTIAWFSVLQLALLAGAAFALLSAVQRVAMQMGRSPAIGWLISVINLLCFGMVFMTSITFTTTAALLGAASVWELLAVDTSEPSRQVIREVTLSLVWLVLGYMLRDISALTNLSFWVGALLAKGLLGTGEKEWRRVRAKPLFISLGIAVLIMAVLLGIRALDIRLSGQEEYLNWINASVAGIDYGGIHNANLSVLQQAGWSENERQLVLNWYFMDGNITTQAFEAFQSSVGHPDLQTMVLTITRLLAKSRNILYFLLLMAACGLGAVLCAVADGHRRLWAFLTPIGVGLVTFVELGYLAMHGRLPMRAAAAVLLPGCALMLWLFLEGLSRLEVKGFFRRTARLVISLAFCFLIFKCVRCSWGLIYNPVFSRGEETTQSNQFRSLENYALDHTDRLYITENALGMDWRLYPDWRDGKAENVLYNWGGWNNHSQGYNAIFARYGLDNDHFAVTDFIDNGRLRLVTTGDEPCAAFMAYLREKAGGPVTAEKEYAGSGFTVYRFSGPAPKK